MKTVHRHQHRIVAARGKLGDNRLGKRRLARPRRPGNRDEQPRAGLRQRLDPVHDGFAALRPTDTVAGTDTVSLIGKSRCRGRPVQIWKPDIDHIVGPGFDRVPDRQRRGDGRGGRGSCFPAW